MKPRKTKNLILPIVIIAIIVISLLSSNTIYAEVNEYYSTTDSVPSEGLNDAMSGSTLLTLLVKLVYAIGRWIEWIVGIIFAMLTGTSDFPWADKIVFNAVPLLDVNFINPAEDSYVGNAAVQGVLQNLYSTILALAVSFFGIVVLITAIKLVVSTIASEKAKYKQAIVDWLIGFVMLFCIHYFVSFVFYLNEQLVVVASQIVSSQLEKAGDDIFQLQASTIGEEIAQSADATGAVASNGQAASKVIRDYPSITSAYFNMNGENGLYTLLQTEKAWWSSNNLKSEKKQYAGMANIILWAVAKNVSVKDLREARNSLVTGEIRPGSAYYLYTSYLPQEFLAKSGLEADLFKGKLMKIDDVVCWSDDGGLLFRKDYFKVTVGSYNGQRLEVLPRNKWEEFIYDEEILKMTGKTVTCVDTPKTFYYVRCRS